MSRNTLQPRTFRSLRAGVTITALALGMTAAGPGVALAAEQYKVRPGDTLALIAEKFGYDGENAWRRIFNANTDLANPDLIVPGQKLTVPDKDERVEPRPLPQAAPVPSDSGTSTTATTTSTATPSGSVWTALAACESGGDWAANTGNGYYGGLQFSLSSWQAVGGSGYPHEASPATQIAMGQRLQASQGWGAWPSCASQLGLY
jgi:LysM repeat protein